MALLLADKRVTIFILAGKPADPANLTVDDFDDAINAGSKLFDQDTYLRPSGSDTVNYPLLNRGNKSGFGSSNYEAQLNVARYYDPETGKPSEEHDDVWPLVKEKGSPLWLVERVGPDWDAEIEEGQEVSLYEGTTDIPQPPQTREDYLRQTVPVAVSDAWTGQLVAA